MPLSLIQTLDALSHDLTPDQVLLQIQDPFQNFIKFCDFNDDLLSRLLRRDNGVALFRWHHVGRQCWSGVPSQGDLRGEAEYTRCYGVNEISFTWGTMYRLKADRYLFNSWSCIGYEHRMRPDLVFPS